MFPIEESDGGKIILVGGEKVIRTFFGEKDKTIGLLSKRTDGRFQLRKPSLIEGIHLFRKSQSWGTNVSILKVLPSDSIIKLEVDTGVLWVTAAEYLAEGEYLSFRKHGTQVFLGKEKFKKVK